MEENEYEKCGLSLFGEKANRSKRIRIRCIDWKNVLEDAIENNVDLAKVDCEGCEKFLLDVDDKIINKIPEWIIECHSSEILRILYRKFSSCGFKLSKRYFLSYPNIVLLCFKH